MMKEILSRGGKTPKERLDELFSRKTLGAVLFGAAVSKVVEKINILGVSAIIIFMLDVEISEIMWIAAALLLFWWAIELLFFIYLYVKWEKAMEQISSTSEEATKTAQKASEAGTEIKEKIEETRASQPDYKLNLDVFGKEITCALSFDSSKK